MDRFWDALKNSIIVQGALTAGIWGTIIYMIIAGREIPQVLIDGGLLVLGFFFGAKQYQGQTGQTGT